MAGWRDHRILGRARGHLRLAGRNARNSVAYPGLCHVCGALRLRIIPRLTGRRGYWGHSSLIRCLFARQTGCSGRCLFLVVKEAQRMCAGHLAQHARRQRVGLGVVADVDVQTVHHIEVRVGKQLLHGQVAHLGRHRAGHEGFEVRRGGERLGVRQRGWWRIGCRGDGGSWCSWCRHRSHWRWRRAWRRYLRCRGACRRRRVLHRLARLHILLAARPATEESVSHGRPRHGASR